MIDLPLGISIFLDYVAFGIKLAAFTVLTWGLFVALYNFGRLEIRQIKGENICSKRENLRHHFGSYLLLTFEILIAADLVITLVNPTMEEVIFLGMIVLIRTVLNFFLNKELAADRHDCHLR